MKCTSTLTAHGSTSSIVHGTTDVLKPSDQVATSQPSGDISIQCHRSFNKHETPGTTFTFPGILSHMWPHVDMMNYYFFQPLQYFII